jgi:hypothetical protein
MQIIEIRKLIDRLRADKCIIFSTHILQEATAVASRLVIVNGGRKVADGTADDLASQAGDIQKVRLLVRGDGLGQVLQSVPGISSVNRVNPPQGYSRFELQTLGGAIGARAVCERISTLCRERGVVIAELAPQSLTLEETFLQLLRGTKPEPAAAAPAVEVAPKAVAPKAEKSEWDAVDASLNARTKVRPKPAEVDPDPFATSVAGPMPTSQDSDDTFGEDAPDAGEAGGRK